MQKSEQSVDKTKRSLFIIFVIIVDFILIDRLTVFRFSLSYFLSLSIAIGLNAYLIIYLTYKKNRNVVRQDNHVMMAQVIKDIPFAIPTHEEVFIQQEHKKDVGSSPLEETMESIEVSNITTQRAKTKYHDIEIIKPKEVLKNVVSHKDEIDTLRYTDELSTYINESGLLLDRNFIREMFASMATSKLIVLKQKTPEIALRFIELFSDFVGITLYQDDPSESSVTYGDLFTESSKLSDCIKHASVYENQLHFFIMTNMDYSHFQDGLKPIVDYALNPLLQTLKHQKSGTSKLIIPQNLWFIILDPEDNAMCPSIELSKCAVWLDLEAKLSKPKDVVYLSDLQLSYETLINLLSEGYEQYFIEEDDWKKIDEIVKEYQPFIPFLSDNRLYRQLERYTSTFIMYGGDKVEVMDRVLYAKLLMVISNLKVDRRKMQHADILMLFEKLFGLEYLNKSKALLKIIHDSLQ